MLQYTRRYENTSTPKISSESDVDNNPILTYCNWNYKKEYHLDSEKLTSILKNFDSKNLAYYVRIFNETPINAIKYFIDTHNLSKYDLKNIWTKVSNIEGIRLQKDFWQKYNG